MSNASEPITGRTADRKHVLIVGAGTFQLPLVQDSARDYAVSLAAPVISTRFEPYYEDSVICDVRDFQTILDFARGLDHPIDGVLTDATDIPVLTVARVANALGLVGIPEETARLFTDKSLMRQKMDELGIKTLPHKTVHSIDEARQVFAEIGGEVIIKPLDAQGSRGVQVCSTEEELIAKYAEAERWSSDVAGNGVLIEKLACGREFVVEGLALNHEFWNLCIGDTLYFDLEDSLSAKERTFPTTADDELRDRVLKLNEEIVTGFGLKHGITHSEFIMDGDDIYLIETAARGGGAFISSDLIPLSCGLDTSRFLLGVATGEIRTSEDVAALFGFSDVAELDSIALRPQKHCAYVGFYIPEGEVLSVEGAEEVRSLPYVHRTQIEGIENRVGTIIRDEHSDKTTRLLITLEADSRAQLEERMAHVRDTLKMEVRSPEGEIVGLIWS